MGGGHHEHSPEAMPKLDQDIQSFKDNLVPLGFRDTCGHLLVALNNCRHQTFSNPAKCMHERHTYEECEYIQWLQRCEQKKKQKQEM